MASATSRWQGPPFLLLALLWLARAAPSPSGTGEVWSAFFAFNTTTNCGTDTVGARFFTARFSPAATPSGWRHFVSEPYTFPFLAPIHSKTLTFGGGATMAADAVGRRAWALLGTTDWTPHTWIVQLAFSAYRFNSTRVVGVCELVNTSMSAQTMQKLTYSATIIKGGGAYFLNSDPSNYYGATVSVVSVPPLNPNATAVPPCTLTNVSAVSSSGAFSPFIIPLPLRGTDRRGNPLLVELARNAGNNSQIAVQAWSALSGKLVYNVTWACGEPSYLYSCPPTNGGMPDGLNGAYLVRGMLLLGGGSWSAQQYFMGALTALALPEEGGEDGGGEAAPSVPVLTYVNASSSQGTWFPSSSANLFVAGPAPNGWPLTVQLVTGYGGTCVQPLYTSQMISTSISRDGATVISTPFGSSDGVAPGCPFRQAEIPTWWATAACAGASFAFPDNLAA